MTTRTKIAVSLPSELVQAARGAVAAGRSPNVSAYVTTALAERIKLDDLTSLLDQLLAESGGPMTDPERAQIDKAAGWA